MGNGGALGHLEALDASLGSGIRYVSANDLILVHQQRGINRRCGSGIVVDLVDVAHDFLPGELAQIIALAFLQGVVALEDLTGVLRDLYLAGLFWRCCHIPAEIRQEFDPGVVVSKVSIISAKTSFFWVCV